MASGVKELDGRVGCRDMVMFDPWKIVVEKDFNPRSPEGLRANIDRLKPMIEAAQGVLEALWVRRDGERCVLIGGESRLFATRELLKEGKLPKFQGKDSEGNPKPFGVPVIHREGASEDAERISLALLENSGAPLEKWELGKSYARLVNAGWEVEDIAKRQGKTPQWVSSCIILNDSPAELKQMLIMGQVSEEGHPSSQEARQRGRYVRR